MVVDIVLTNANYDSDYSFDSSSDTSSYSSSSNEQNHLYKSNKQNNMYNMHELCRQNRQNRSNKQNKLNQFNYKPEQNHSTYSHRKIQTQRYLKMRRYKIMSMNEMTEKVIKNALDTDMDTGYDTQFDKNTPFINYLINKRINFCELGASTHIAAFVPVSSGSKCYFIREWKGKDHYG